MKQGQRRVGRITGWELLEGASDEVLAGGRSEDENEDDWGK